jgi:hypothetical protein
VSGLLADATPRSCVARAASMAEARGFNPTLIDWLRKDERGTWERDAAVLLEAASDAFARSDLDPTTHDVEADIALALIRRGLDAQLADLKRRAPGAKRARARR